MTNGPTGVRAERGRSYSMLEAIAIHLRGHLDYSPIHSICGVTFFDKINDLFVSRRDGSPVPVQTGIEPLGDGREGLSRYNCETHTLDILLAPDTYNALENESPRATYCLVHEFAHAILHSEQLERLARLPRTSQMAFHRGAAVPHPMYLDTEWQANALASALLMPAKGLAYLEERYRVLTERVVIQQYDVSATAARIRIGVYSQRKGSLVKI